LNVILNEVNDLRLLLRLFLSPKFPSKGERAPAAWASDFSDEHQGHHTLSLRVPGTSPAEHPKVPTSRLHITNLRLDECIGDLA
jgi:hypothetical protein